MGSLTAGKRQPLELFLATLAVAAVLVATGPRTVWEFDESLFFQALHRYEPVAHHPPPPGYPLFIAAARLVRLLVPSDLLTFVALNTASSVIAFVLFATAFGEIGGSRRAGLAGALLLFFSPALLVHATIPVSEPGALALVAASLLFAARGRPVPMALFAALAVGWRIQFSIFVVPFFLTALVVLVRTWRERARALVVFTAGCLSWLVPLTVAVGGIAELIRFETGQAAYLTEHDADVSRSGWTPAMIAFRFVAHPWGTKLSSFPVLLAATAGLVTLLVQRRRAMLPFFAGAAVYVAVALAVMDPADGVRYAIPFQLFVAFCAGAGVARAARAAAAGVGEDPLGAPAPVVFGAIGVFAVGSVAYVSTLLVERSTTPSPPAAAAKFALWSQPRNAIALYDLPLWPHSQVFFPGRHMRIHDGLARFYDRPDVPLFIYADGSSSLPGAKVFRWQLTDAYSKLTRNHYRVVSVVPLPPERRFLPLRGVNTTEREPDGEEWRWLSSPAEIRLPTGGLRTLVLELGLPVRYERETNTLRIAVNGVAARTVQLRRGEPVEVQVDVPAGSPLLTFSAAYSVVPAQVAGSLNRDPRRLAVKLYDLHLQPRAAAAAALPRAASR